AFKSVLSRRSCASCCRSADVAIGVSVRGGGSGRGGASARTGSGRGGGGERGGGDGGASRSRPPSGCSSTFGPRSNASVDGDALAVACDDRPLAGALG